MIAVIISANSEWQAVIEHLDPAARLNSPFGEYFYSQVAGQSLLFFQGGWGKVSAAASTQFVIDQFNPEVIINLGTCGGLRGKISTGEVILVAETLYHDIHERMSDPDDAIRFYTTALDLSFLMQPYPQPVRLERIACADEDIDPQKVGWLSEKYQVVASDWESAAIAWVASRNHVKCLILRGVTDLVGPDGGEIYNDNAAGFDQRANKMMQSLVDALPGWINQIKH